jgi:hypothetical protein
MESRIMDALGERDYKRDTTDGDLWGESERNGTNQWGTGKWRE